MLKWGSGVDLACGPQVPSSPITLMAILFTHQANNTFFQETSDGIRIDGGHEHMACLQGGPTSGNAIQIGRMHFGYGGYNSSAT